MFDFYIFPRTPPIDLPSPRLPPTSLVPSPFSEDPDSLVYYNQLTTESLPTH